MAKQNPQNTPKAPETQVPVAAAEPTDTAALTDSTAETPTDTAALTDSTAETPADPAAETPADPVPAGCVKVKSVVGLIINPFTQLEHTGAEIVLEEIDSWTQSQIDTGKLEVCKDE